MTRSAVERVSTLTVTFNHADEIDACLEAALRQGGSGLEVEVVVVDNASSDGTAERVARWGEAARLVRMASNHGFAAGMNAAFAASTGAWILLLNPDCVMDPGCAGALRDHLAAQPDVAAASALLRELDGSPQLFARQRLDLSTALWAFTHVGRRVDERVQRRAWKRRRYASEWANDAPRRPTAVFSPAAACVMIRRRDLEPRPFDEAFPLFFNDDDLYERLHGSGRRVEIVPSGGATHGYGTSVRRAQQNEPARMRAEWVASLRRYAGRRWRPPARVALDAALIADAAYVYALALAGRGGAGHKHHARGTLGGFGLPGGAPPVLTDARRR